MWLKFWKDSKQADSASYLPRSKHTEHFNKWESHKTDCRTHEVWLVHQPSWSGSCFLSIAVWKIRGNAIFFGFEIDPLIVRDTSLSVTFRLWSAVSVPRGVAERLEARQRSLHDGIALPYVLVSHPKTRETWMPALFMSEWQWMQCIQLIFL